MRWLALCGLLAADPYAVDFAHRVLVTHTMVSGTPSESVGLLLAVTNCGLGGCYGNKTATFQVQNHDRTLDYELGQGFSGACGDLASYTPPGDTVTYFFLEFLTDPGVTAAFYTPVACFCRMDGKGCALDDGKGYLYPSEWKYSQTIRQRFT
jgi:hypothetical protein